MNVFQGVDEKHQIRQWARQFASEQIFGKEVSVDSTDTDRYGRTIGIVWYDGNKNLNEELLKAGYAWHYKRYDNQARWAALEAEARKAKLGLWVAPNAVAPWEWRK